MGIPDRELEGFSAQRRAIAHALDLEPLLEALRHSLDHVGDERARQAVQRAILAAFGRPLDNDLAVVLLDQHAAGDLLAQLSQRSVNHDASRTDRNAHPGRNFDWTLSDSAHVSFTVPRAKSRDFARSSPYVADDFPSDAALRRRLARD